MKKRILVTVLVLLGVLLTSCGVFSKAETIKNEGFPLNERWSYSLNGRIYGLAVSDQWIAVSQSNGITAIDTETGSYLWGLSVPLDTDSRLVFSNDKLIVASSSQIKVIDKSGKELSTVNFDSQSESSQIVAAHSNYVFVRRIPSWKLEIYDIETGALVWEIPAGRGSLSLSFDESTNNVYLATASFISAYDISNGNLIWKIDKNTSTGVLDAGVLFAASDENTLQVAAVDVHSLDQFWDTQISNNVRTAIYNLAVFDNMLIASTDFGLLAIDKEDGHNLWQSETNEFFYGRSVLINDVIYARGTHTSVIYAISPTDGRYLGYLRLGNPSIISTSQREYDILYQTDQFLIFPFENTVYAMG